MSNSPSTLVGIDVFGSMIKVSVVEFQAVSKMYENLKQERAPVKKGLLVPPNCSGWAAASALDALGRPHLSFPTT